MRLIFVKWGDMADDEDRTISILLLEQELASGVGSCVHLAVQPSLSEYVCGGTMSCSIPNFADQRQQLSLAPS
jgi:hypothetical protein